MAFDTPDRDADQNSENASEDAEDAAEEEDAEGATGDAEGATGDDGGGQAKGKRKRKSAVKGRKTATTFEPPSLEPRENKSCYDGGLPRADPLFRAFCSGPHHFHFTTKDLYKIGPPLCPT